MRSSASLSLFRQSSAVPAADGVYVSGTALSSPAGLLAGETLALLDGESPADAPDSVQYATRTYWYDSRERLVQSLESRPDGSTIRTSFQYDLQGNVLKRKETVTGPGNAGTTAMLSKYTYDARGRVLSLGRTLDGETLDTVEYGYDNLGHLASKTVGGKLTETYTYDLRGWMKDLEASRGTDVLFSEGLMYDLHRMPGSVSQYSGNISEIETVQYGKPANVYSYIYDRLSRLTDARHFIGGSTTASDTDTERSISYDLNGNILGMTRYGAESSGASVLGFSYTGNRLTGAAESSAAGSPNYMYAYDSNGNRTLDSRTGLEFTHNLLNLPCDVKDVLGNMKLRYTYLSDGTKASALDAAGDGLLYRGSFVYEKDGSNVNLESVAWDEGRIRNKLYQGLLHGDDPIDVTDTLAVTDTLPEFPRHPWHPFNRVLPAEEENADPVEIEDLTDVQAVVFSPFQDQWFVKDHLGNVRSVVNISKDSDAPVSDVILEQNDYLPYGTKVSDASTPALSGNRYRYADKEEQRFGTFDSQLLDFGARYYDSWTCQWTAVDPMAEKYVGSSPTSYCALNPVNIVDLNGMDWYQCDSTGYYTWFDGSDDREGYTYIGGKGALFGEYELFVEDSYFRLSGKKNSLYTNGSTIEFASNEKTGEDILLEFYNNSGPLITVFGPNCRLTKLIANWSMMTDYINEYQGFVLNGSSDIPGQYTNAKIPGGYRQITEAGQYDIWNFIGSANYDGIIDSSTNTILNIVGDCKSRRSLFYHLAKDKSRKECAHLGNNYQLYIWFSSK